MNWIRISKKNIKTKCINTLTVGLVLIEMVNLMIDVFEMLNIIIEQICMICMVNANKIFNVREKSIVLYV